MGIGNGRFPVPDVRAGYLIAVGATAVVAAARYAAATVLGPTPPFPPFIVPVLLAAWVGGLRPGLVATGLGAVAAVALFLAPGTNFPVQSTAQWVGAVLFLAFGGLVSGLCEALHRARRRIDDRRAELEQAAAAARESERRLRLVADSTRVLIAHCDTDRRYLFVNAPYAERFGRTPAEVVGKTIPEVIGAAGYARFAEYVDAALAGRPQEFEVEIPYPGIGPHFMRCAYTPERDAAGRVVGLVAAIIDITDRKRAEDAVRASEERFRTLVDTVSAVVWTTDGAGAIVADSPSWAAFTGQTRDQYRGWGWLEAVHPDDQAHTAAVWRTALDTLTRYETYYRLRRHDGVFRHVVATGAPVRDAAGRLREWVGNCVDVTDRLVTQDAIAASEERYRWLVENTAEAIWRCEVDEPIPTALPADAQVDRMFRHGYLAEANAGMARIYGYDSPAAMAGLRLSRLLPDEPGNRAFLRAFVHAGYRLLDAESVEVGADGEPRYLVNGLVGVVEGGHLARAFGTSRDVTARRQAEDALRRNEERLRLALDVARLGTWEWLPPDGPVTADDRGREVSGLPPGPLTRAEVVRHIHPDDWPSVQTAFRAAAGPDADGVYAAEFRVVRPDGAVRWVAVRGQTTFIEDGAGRRPVRTLGTVLDITDRKQAEETLREQAARLTQADRRKDEFLATLAHELRNPLAPLRNALEIVRLAGHDPTTLADARGLMERQLAHLVRLVDDLLDVSRITRGKLTLRPRTVAFADVIHAAVEAARPLLDQRRHTLTVTLPPEPVRLLADPTRLAQVFANLLTNAAKYTDPGGRVTLAAKLLSADGGPRPVEPKPAASDESWSESVFRAPPAAFIEVSVTDTGSGIPADQLDHIFELFTQVPTTLDRSQGGLGIGLSLVRGLVQMHGGAIAARSPGPGQGSEFVVTLPVTLERGLQTAGPKPAAAADPAPGTGSHPAVRVPQSAAARKRVLVADDNPDSAASLAALMELFGCEVRVAADGLAAVEAAEAFRPAVVLLDLGMPKLDGYEACRRIRERPWGRAMVLIAQTGWGQADDRKRTKEAGFDHHLVKPIDPAALTRLLTDPAGAAT